MQPHPPPVPAELERRLARLELTLLEVVTAVGMLVGELALPADESLEDLDGIELGVEEDEEDAEPVGAADDDAPVDIED